MGKKEKFQCQSASTSASYNDGHLGIFKREKKMTFRMANWQEPVWCQFGLRIFICGQNLPPPQPQATVVFFCLFTAGGGGVGD